MWLSTPKAILVSGIFIALAILFRVDDASVTQAKVDVAGTDSYDLNFKRAVKSVVERCNVTGYVGDKYLDDGDISC